MNLLSSTPTMPHLIAFHRADFLVLLPPGFVSFGVLQAHVVVKLVVFNLLVSFVYSTHDIMSKTEAVATENSPILD
jgi:hypothetical protein